MQPVSRPISFSRIAPASGSPRAVTATPIAARSQRRISALTRIALLSRGSMLPRSAIGHRALDAGDVAVAVDRQQVALAEQHVGRAAVAASQLGDAVFGAGELGFETAAQIGLPRGQRQQRVAALAAVGEAEAAFADGRARAESAACRAGSSRRCRRETRSVAARRCSRRRRTDWPAGAPPARRRRRGRGRRGPG